MKKIIKKTIVLQIEEVKSVMKEKEHKQNKYEELKFDFLKLNRQLNRSKLEIQDIYNVNLKKSSSLD